jgi:undecaprenyl-diphosphatase
MPKSLPTHQWLSDKDEALCVRINQASRIAWVCKTLCLISRLGDGAFWYVLMLAMLAWPGQASMIPFLHMVITGVACTLSYKWLKVKTARPRPSERNQAIQRAVSPLDEYSFPSGHTLHAVAFSLVAVYYYPALIALLLPFTVLVAASRIVLGLHYPSDVLASMVIGSVIASASLLLW